MQKSSSLEKASSYVVRGTSMVAIAAVLGLSLPIAFPAETGSVAFAQQGGQGKGGGGHGNGGQGKGGGATVVAVAVITIATTMTAIMMMATTVDMMSRRVTAARVGSKVKAAQRSVAGVVPERSPRARARVPALREARKAPARYGQKRAFRKLN